MNEDRWERRAFLGGPSEPARRLAALGTPLGDAYRTDTYLLTGDADLLPKLRGTARLEVKRRVEVRGGLERWVVETAAAFPLAASDVAALLPGAPEAALTSPEALLRHAADAHLLVLPVRKHRRRFTLGGAEAEATGVIAGGRVAETVGIEAASYEEAEAAARTLGLLDLPNASYGDWLRRA